MRLRSWVEGWPTRNDDDNNDRSVQAGDIFTRWSRQCLIPNRPLRNSSGRTLFQELGNTLGNNLAYICLIVTTKVFGKSLKPLICELLIEKQ